MRQHNMSTERDYWSKARDRKRMQARYAIRKRILASDAASSVDTAIAVEDHLALVIHTLEEIVKGNRSFFSTVFVERNIQLLESQLPIELLYLSDVGELRGLSRMTSLFGSEKVKEMYEYFQSLSFFTFMEYATWFRRFHVVLGLLMGGVSPTLRGDMVIDGEDKLDTTQVHCGYRKDLDYEVRSYFFKSVPKFLQIYIVQQTVEMRQARRSRSCQKCIGGCCSFRADMVYQGCQHGICYSCFWSDVVENLGKRESDVVDCLICGYNKKEFTGLDGTHRMAFEESLQRYNMLPATPKDLKNQKTKKETVAEEGLLCRTWSSAVVPCCGRSKEVRADKWFSYGEKGACHFVRSCMDLGIDGNLRNEYGQTVLFLAVWRRDAALAKLLLDFGCDPSISANDGTSVADLASFQKEVSVIECLMEAEVVVPAVCSRTRVFRSGSSPSLSTLITDDLDHAGAGSYIIDNALEQESVAKLIKLWKELPVEPAKVKKAFVPCSVRSYFCDAKNELTSALTDVLIGQNCWEKEGLFIWPQMRFLCYHEVGAVLAPHVDLCRAHPLNPMKPRSTHSFLLYLTDCDGENGGGGETTLLESLTGSGVMARVSPKSGRLLLFPHECPHRGDEVLSVPKLLIRGEVHLAPIEPNGKS